MSAEKTEALRLAAVPIFDRSITWQSQATIELRRLYLVEQALERCKAVCDATSEGWRADAERWQAQRDALLEALKLAVRQNEHDMLMTGEELRQCRAAIKAVEESK